MLNEETHHGSDTDLGLEDAGVTNAKTYIGGLGLAILLTSVGINLLGDFLRDTYDPRLALV